MIKYLQFCRLCGSPHLEPVLDLGLNHIQGAFITQNNPNPPKRKIPNVIVRCDPKKGGCSLVQSNITPPPEILFSSYFYKSGVNESMRLHLKNVVDELLKFDPNPQQAFPQQALDIAANDLTLLRNYPKEIIRWGIDPNNIILEVENDGIKVVNDFFPSKRAEISSPNLKFDFITALAVMYDLDFPLEFTKAAIDKLTSNGVFCFEVMYLPTIIKNLNWDTFLGEHLTHWSLFTIENLIRKAGGKLIDARLTPTNGGSILALVTHENCNTYDTKERQFNILELKKQEFDLALDERDIFIDFRNRVEQHKRDLKTTLQSLKSQGKRICLYACSTKSNVIVESAGIQEYFDYGIERSEEKVGGRTLWGLPIKSEAEARNDADENTVWFVGPYFFKDSIISREREFISRGGKLLFPLPEIVFL